MKQKNIIVRKQKSITKERHSAFTFIMAIVLLVYSILLLGLLIWAVLTTFKTNADFRLNISGFPQSFNWVYGEVLSKFYIKVSATSASGEPIVNNVYIWQMILYSVLYALGSAFFNTLVVCLTSYMCARFKFRFSKVIYAIVIIVMVLPIVGSLPSEIQMAQSLGLYDQIWGLWIMKASFIGMYFLIFFNYFKSIPMAYTEAAKIDGASNITILFRIVLPLAKNVFFTVMLLSFIGFWNDYQAPLVMMPSKPTLAYGVYLLFRGSETTIAQSIPVRMACNVILLVPILILFLIFHKKLLGNLSLGGIKG